MTQVIVCQKVQKPVRRSGFQNAIAYLIELNRGLFNERQTIGVYSLESTLAV